MDWASAAIGLGGIVVAAMGLLFTYRTRLSPYQQTLYERQLDAASSVLSSLGRYHDKVRRFLLDPHAAGATWADLDRHNAGEGFRLNISAYGPTLCVAEVHFKDEHSPIVLHRYLDFIASPSVTRAGGQ